MRARKMDRRIAIYAVSETQSGSGAGIQSQTLLATVACEQRPTRGYESTEAQKDQARGEKLFRIRWRSDVTNKHVLVFEAVTYDILSIAEVGRRQGLDITALARLA